ncbi:hypothetical protein CRM22_010581 [Opisthorchis felineus]|uniref:Uncharacterized protein n=1 Tax=Opisthorchis felineus TaxID=147828 RepID=A0A4S2L2W4_OPIFE|nr:hypothetical protein CRM22_010581 [Opisthorchis felineus]
MTPYGDGAVKLFNRSFHVDDCLISLPTKRVLKTTAKQFREALASGGFNLTGFFSNVEEALCDVLTAISNTTPLHLDRQPDYARRKLGVPWHNTTDYFCFKFERWEGIPTRRALLSYVASLFDPLGMFAPVLLPAKCPIHDFCRRKVAWDDVTPEKETLKLKNWLMNLQNVESIRIPWCIRPKSFASDGKTELRGFYDSSETGYGAAIYKRLIVPPRIPHCALLTGKSRVAPIKYTSIPRLELTSAVLSAGLTAFVRGEQLQTVSNRTTRHERLASILDYSEPEDRMYVESKRNLADIAFRGLQSDTPKLSMWLSGHEFLRKVCNEWLPQPVRCPIPVLHVKSKES